MQTAMTLIRLGGCPGWSESTVGVQTILLALSCCGLYDYDIRIWWPSVLFWKTFRQPSVYISICNDISKKNIGLNYLSRFINNWAPSSEFVSSSIPSWQTLTAHAQPFRVARDLAFCLKVPLDSLLVWASSEGSGETARMRRLAWAFAARIGYKY